MGESRTTRASVPSWPDAFTGEDLVQPLSDSGPEAGFLLEDVKFLVLPERIGDHNIDIEVDTIPSNPDFQDMVARGLDRRSYQPDAESAVRDFVGETAQTITRSGKAILEMSITPPAAGQAFSSFILQPLLPEAIFNIADRWFQYIPKKVQVSQGLPSFVELSPERLIVMAPVFEGFQLADIYQRLDKLSRLTPLSVLTSSEIGTNTIGYDFKLHESWQTAAILKLTRPIGWPTRNLVGKDILEPFYVYRRLLFRKFLNRLSAVVIDGLNKVFTAIDSQATIRVSGLPTTAAIDEAIERLLNGTLSPKSIVDAIL